MDLNVKHNTIKLIGDKYSLDDLGYGNDFLYKITKAQSMKEILGRLVHRAVLTVKNYMA